MIAGLRVLKRSNQKTIDFANSGLTKIIGSGPYQISHIDQGRSITLKRNPTYWAKDLPINKGQYNFDVFQVEYFKNAQAQFRLSVREYRISILRPTPTNGQATILRL